MAARSFPSDLALVSPANPWGERLAFPNPLPSDFADRVVLAAQVYAAQAIRFDGYFGSSDDGKHYPAAADGLDAAYYGRAETSDYGVRRDGVADDLTERVWICIDLLVHAYTLAGFPLREAMLQDYAENEGLYTLDGGFPENRPTSHHFFRRVRNVVLYLQRHHVYSEQRITKEQYRDPAFRPAQTFQPGDMIFFGHYGDENGQKGWWRPQHTGIVATVDDRGLPIQIYNLRVSQDMLDEYDGEINQTRPIGGKDVFFKRFSDRYPIIGYARLNLSTDAPGGTRSNVPWNAASELGVDLLSP